MALVDQYTFGVLDHVDIEEVMKIAQILHFE